MDELASFLTPESRVDVKLLALQQVDTYYWERVEEWSNGIR